MAFPVPQHLPRKGRPQDVSSHILTKVGEASNKSLNAALARSWVEELDGNIQQTKDRIYECIHTRLPDFERQLETSKSVQLRLQNLSRNVDAVSDAFSNPETGLLPTLLKSLTEHSTLAQRTSDAAVLHVALAHLLQCRVIYRKLTEFMKEGRLPQAVRCGQVLKQLLDEAPEAVAKAKVTADLKRRLRIVTDNTAEQLSDAYSRSIRISSTELGISSAVQVPHSDTIIPLSDLLASLSTSSLSSHLTVLRRDLITYFIEFPTQQPVAYAVSEEKDEHGAPARNFSIYPTSTHKPASPSTLAYFQSLFDFLSTDLFTHLPNSSRDSFSQSLSKPCVDALLHSMLIPSLPSSLHDLPPFIALAQETAEFEKALVVSLFGAEAKNELDISGWVNNIGSHYARKRRVDILREARDLILSKDKAQEQIFRAEVAQEPETARAGAPSENIESTGDGAETWDFEDDSSAPVLKPTAASTVNGSHKQKAEDESGWDFEDRVEESNGPSESLPQNGNHVHPETAEPSKDEDIEVEDAWGWGDEDAVQDAEDDATLASSTNGQEDTLRKDASVANEPIEDDSSAWDDAWGGEVDTGVDADAPPPPSPVSAPTVQPKAATRLEKFSAKSKGGSQSSAANPGTSSVTPSSTNGRSTAQFSPSTPSSSFTSTTSVPPPAKRSAHVPPPLTTLPQKVRPKETYSISGRAKNVVSLVLSILNDGRQAYHSDVFRSSASISSAASSTSPSTVITQTAPSALDLYRALFPVAAAAELSRHPDRAMRFANDCVYISEELRKHVDDGAVEWHSEDGDRTSSNSSSSREMLRESIERTKGHGEWWYHEMVEKQCSTIRSTLERAEGFVDTGDQERYDECEVIMTEVLRNIRTVGSQWKLVLSRSKYFSAVGSVTEAAISKILEDVLALGDIPELDSRRLAELCRILNAVEGLFIDDSDPEMPSVVVAYVPSWLKYSYLSELLEASIADISYLFDEGALIDFEVDELVNLVRALFADTQLRTNTIAKLQRGHPVVPA